MRLGEFTTLIQPHSGEEKSEVVLMVQGEKRVCADGERFFWEVVVLLATVRSGVVLGGLSQRKRERERERHTHTHAGSRRERR